MHEPITLRICEVDVRECAVTLRLPFRFGNSTKTHGRQVVVRARIALADGRSAWGWAAEALSAKWFDKNPALSDEQNYDQLRLAIELASRRYREQGSGTAFGHFAAAYPFLNEECARLQMPTLIAGYGAALLDRCVIDALGQLTGASFWELMRANSVGMRATPLAPDLAGFDFDSFLGALSPQRRIHVRHTVGLVDPIVATDQPAGTGPNDGLPETLEQVVATYGNRHFKIKLGGDDEADLQRLRAIASVLDRAAAPYHVTLDGNEQYRDVGPVLELLQRMARAPQLQRLYEAILWLEQPLARDIALTADVRPIDALRPVIIDESDANLDAFPAAIALGYRGVSSKNCKGLYKSLVNRARCDVRNAADVVGHWFMSAEDLTTLPGISLQQDLALVSLLGLAHVEKNAHHFVDGMRHRPQAEQRRFAAAHPDLYRLDTLPDGTQVARLKISQGVVEIGSLACPGFAHAVDMDWNDLEPAPASRWPDTVKEAP
jgi:L-alanine-DL-glutamate epimerase-like enolase superfamily enzyme